MDETELAEQSLIVYGIWQYIMWDTKFIHFWTLNLGQSEKLENEKFIIMCYWKGCVELVGIY